MNPNEAPLEDLSHLNPPATRRRQEGTQRAWKKLTPAQKADRALKQAAAGRHNKGRTRIKH